MGIQIGTYNFFKPIRGLWAVSKSVAGKRIKCISEADFSFGKLNIRRGLAGIDSYAADRVHTIFWQMGTKLPTPGIIGLEFPCNAGQVRDFFRLIIRTNATIHEAAEITKVKVSSFIEDSTHEKPIIVENPTVLSPVSPILSSSIDDKIATLKKVLEKNPNLIAAWTSLGVNLIQRGEISEAIEAFNKALIIDSKYVVALINKGVAFTELGKLEEAAVVFDQALKIDPQNNEAWYNKGIILVKQGRSDDAIQAFDEALRYNRSNLDALKNKFILLRGKGELTIYPPENLSMEQALASAFNYYIEGSKFAAQGEFEKSIDLFTKTLEIMPTFAECWHDKGLALLKLRNLDEAITAFDEALKINPKLTPTFYQKAQALLFKKEFDKAIATIDSAIKIHPKFDEGLHLKGVILERQGNLEEALIVYAQALEINSRRAETWYNKGTVLKRLGRNEEAEKCFKRAEKLGLA